MTAWRMAMRGRIHPADGSWPAARHNILDFLREFSPDSRAGI